MREARARRWCAALVLGVLLAAGCGREPDRLVETIYVFGSASTVEIVDADRAEAQKALVEIAAEMQARHRAWHAWEPSEVTAANDAIAAGRSATLSPPLRSLVERALSLAEATEGVLDPTVGGLMALWGFYTSDYPITSPEPTRAQLDAWRAHRPSYRDLHLDGDLLSSANPAARLDFGAIAEGVATEAIRERLRAHGVTHALVALGGDLYAMGRNGNRPWRAALRDPFSVDRPLATLELGDGEALYSSGNYYRYRESPTGTRWPHVIDTQSGLPVSGVAAVGVLHPDPVIADAASTALMVAGEAGFERLLHRLGVRCAVLITVHNEMMVTAAMSARLTLLREPLPLGPPIGTPGPCAEPEPAPE